MEYETTYGTDAVDMGYRNASHRATCEAQVDEMERVDESNKRAQFIAAVGVLCSILILAAFAGIGAVMSFRAIACIVPSLFLLVITSAACGLACLFAALAHDAGDAQLGLCRWVRRKQ